MRVVGEDPLERFFRIVGDDDVEHSAGACSCWIVAAFDKSFAVGIKKCSVETEKANAEPASALCSLWTLLTEPSRKWILRSRGSDDSLVEQTTDFGNSGIGEPVSLCDVGAIELVFGNAVAGAYAEFETTA